jgi:hypothetical protein
LRITKRQWLTLTINIIGQQWYYYSIGVSMQKSKEWSYKNKYHIFKNWFVRHIISRWASDTDPGEPLVNIFQHYIKKHNNLAKIIKLIWFNDFIYCVKRLTWVGIASSPRYYVSHEPIFKNMVLIFVSPFLTLLHWKTNTIVIPHHKVNGPCFIFSLDIFPWSFSPRIINFTYTFLITTFCLRLGICIWGLLASWIRQGCPTSSGYASSWLWLLIDTMKNTKDIHLNVALPENLFSSILSIKCASTTYMNPFDMVRCEINAFMNYAPFS